MEVVPFVWAASGVTAAWLLLVGAIRLMAYRSGEVDHTPALLSVARLAIGLGAAALAVFLVTSAWFLVTGSRPF